MTKLLELLCDAIGDAFAFGFAIAEHALLWDQCIAEEEAEYQG